MWNKQSRRDATTFPSSANLGGSRGFALTVALTKVNFPGHCSVQLFENFHFKTIKRNNISPARLDGAYNCMNQEITERLALHTRLCTRCYDDSPVYPWIWDQRSECYVLPATTATIDGTQLHHR